MEQTGELLAPQATLRELSGSRPRCYSLSTQTETHIGRDPRCPIRVESEDYRNVSRHHAVIRPVNRPGLGSAPGQDALHWEICDLGSVNGTFLNDVRLKSCRWLCVGDRIQLGQSGPAFIFESQTHAHSAQAHSKAQAASSPPTTQSATAQPENQNPTSTGHTHSETPRTGGARGPKSREQESHGQKNHGRDRTSEQQHKLTATQLFPILSTGKDLTRKAYLIPGSITVLVVVSLFLTVGQASQFNPLLATYLGAAGYYFVYQLCGKHKPWWILVSTAAFTLAVLSSPLLQGFIWFFRELLPGQIPPNDVYVPLPILFTRMFLGAGLMEELIKALPVLLLLGLGRLVSAPWHRRLGVWEPLDGILLGAASAVGFTLLETLGQYVPNAAQMSTLPITAPEAQLAGLQLLIPRLIGSIAGHMAYSGYLGYFIGLSVLKPKYRWQILAVGYGTAALLHALWNVMGSYSAVLLTVVGVLSYAFLAAAILKARALSPTRSQNFATRLVDDL